MPAGGFSKPCNTTGTATDGGYPEATFAWRVARRAARPARAARRHGRADPHSNRQDRWGPCVDARGRAGNRDPADLKVSIHGDGSLRPGRRGFHVIAPDRPRGRGPTTSTGPSRRLALASPRRRCVPPGVPVANYIAGGDGLDFRSDLGTLNLSDVPTVMVELGNMRDARDARRMTTRPRPGDVRRGLASGVQALPG